MLEEWTGAEGGLKGLDDDNARFLETLLNNPPTMLRKRRRTGKLKYCLKVTNGTKTKRADTGPVIAPAARRRLSGTRPGRRSQ